MLLFVCVYSVDNPAGARADPARGHGRGLVLSHSPVVRTG